MSDFDDGYEAGYWGADGIPNWIDEENDYKNKREEMVVTLTPKNFLKQHQRNKRLDLYRHPDQMSLEILHNRYNEHDFYALEVYCENIFIGNIRKKFEDRDETEKINQFCFDGKLFIGANISNQHLNKFVIYRHQASYSKAREYGLYNYEEEKDKTYRRQAENILYRFNNIPQQDTEALTLKYALNHRDTYLLNDQMVAALKMRLAKIATEQTGAAGREIGTAAIDATEKILTESLDIAGKTMKFFGFKK